MIETLYIGQGGAKMPFWVLPEVLGIQFSILIAVLGLALRSIYIGVGALIFQIFISS